MTTATRSKAEIERESCRTSQASGQQVQIKIKRNDKVEVIAGKDKGKRGRVLRVIADKNRLLVEGVMMVKKHVKPNPQRNIKGGIASRSPPSTSRTSCWSTARATRPASAIAVEGDKKVRFSKASGNTIPEKKK